MIPPFITAYVIRRSSQGPLYLLIRRCCGDSLHGTWQMVTGGVLGKETGVEAALREIEEETGLFPSSLYSADTVETVYIHTQNKIFFSPVFVAFVEQKEVSLSPKEHDAYEWVDYEEAQKRLVWPEQQRSLSHVHSQFGLKDPNPFLLIPFPAPMEKIVRLGVYGVIFEKGKWLLAKQKRGPHARKFDLPGGKIEAGETIEEALKRECQEEIGLVFDGMEPLDILSAETQGTKENGIPYFLHQIGLIYLVRNFELLSNQIPELEFEWLGLEQLSAVSLAPFAQQIFDRSQFFSKKKERLQINDSPSPLLYAKEPERKRELPIA